MEWMILPFKRYAEFTGRSRRMEYWMFALLNIIVYAVLAILVFGIMGAGGGFLDSYDPANPMTIYGGFFSGLGLLFVLWWLVVLIPGIAVNVRRLHDRDMSGWWYLGFVVASMIPLVGIIAAIAYLVLMLLPGTDGPNRFGPDPKDASSAETFA
ncbi:DUF805 domain-containing protein [Erythrobacter alti]|uniref:DUF805 domain-containing protein n=1 Tax=Erythrobacter alti TaxID=1896145 RepID=UPI0030F37D83